jgi:tripartite-type tricarboxylate transporter receptor subunit TctC
MRRVTLLSLACLILFVQPGVAATYPTRAVTVICPWAAGGGTDRLTRYLADQLRLELGVPFVVENKTGGNGGVGHGAGARAKADGYTVTHITLEIATVHWLGLADVSYKDFKPIMQFNEDASSVLVRADAPWKNVKELLAYIKANPGKLLFSGSGAGTIWDLARIGMLNVAGIPVDAVTWVPTTGAAPSLVELLGGHVDVVTCSLAEAAAQVQAGTVRALAVMADSRLPSFPEVPTLKEQGIDWSAGTWRGFGVPAGTPDEVVEVLYKAMSKIVASDGFKEFMDKNGFGTRIRGPKEFGDFMAAQDQAWNTVLKLGGYIQ